MGGDWQTDVSRCAGPRGGVGAIAVALAAAGAEVPQPGQGRGGGRGETRTRPHGAQAHEVAHASQLRGKLSACLAKHGWARMADQVDIQAGE